MIVNQLDAVPHLTTAPTGPLLLLESHLLENQPRIESWFRSQFLQTPAPFYASVDLRNAGFKLAPVDTNLFPAGFNNLSSAFEGLCIQAIQSAMERIYPSATRMLLIPESHTRNLYYLESLATLQDLIGKAGFEVRLGSLLPDLEASQTLELPSGRKVHLEPLRREGNKVGVGNFFPCVVLLNNDLSGGRPPVLENIEQPLIPPLELGWSNRIKSEHFGHYRTVTNEFAELVDIDPWLIDPLFRNCGEIDFMKREGEDCVARNAGALLNAIQEKYDRYGIAQKPYVVVKAESGTYGMGITTLHSPEEAHELNRKQRTRMSKTKEGQAVSRVIVQEGVYTFETWGNPEAVAEPVVYMIDHFVVGGFYRVHTGRGRNENLNAPGMHFEPLAFAEVCNNPDSREDPDAGKNRFYAYGVIARLALLAAAREVAEHMGDETK
ncbi:glutamate--cysteine ligase [Thiohalomonas denitrificans]|uniref:Glutamate--cysteine ligase n=1 Tax=Thiohalomonas denitrificans TaxID=415747 RepID=A0A1G5QJD2_9GAMM|nr:glutamate--cysteine ligase [Thiohalomonas denitrificans]SCZ61857.1 glutamate--cysteine ligase [Thiohalomonas denitrificans]